MKRKFHQFHLTTSDFSQMGKTDFRANSVIVDLKMLLFQDSLRHELHELTQKYSLKRKFHQFHLTKTDFSKIGKTDFREN